MLSIIRTAIDTDLKSIYLPQMRRYRENNADKGIILIVPDSLSHNAERVLAKEFGGSYEGNNEILTFHQMIRRFLPNISKRLSATGKRMLLLRAVKNAELADNIYASMIYKTSFLDSMSELFEEFRKYGVTAEDLRKFASDTNKNILKDKISAAAEIYNSYKTIFADEGFTDSDEDLDSVSVILNENRYFSDKAVWIAGFDNFLPHQLKVLSVIITTAPEVNIMLVKGASDDSELFFETENSTDKILDICRQNGISFQYNTEYIHPEKKDDLIYLTDNYENLFAEYDGNVQNIHIIECDNIYAETEFAAKKICDLVLEDGYRYCDIGVVVSDADSYIPFTEAVFSELKIPYFSDNAISVSEHPAAMLITSVSEIVREKMSTQSVLYLFRTGLTNISDYDTDIIENNALKLGIRGKMWLDEKYWHKADTRMFDGITGAKNDDGEIISEWQNAYDLLNAVYEFSKNAFKKKTVREYCVILFELFEKIKVQENILHTAEQLLSSNPNESMRFAEVWNLLTEICSQAVEVIGNEEMSFDEFCRYITSGLTESTMDIIPAGIDRVIVGTADAFSPDEVKVLFILGANSGKIPKISSREGFLSDADREELSQNGISTELFGSRKNAREEFFVLKLLSYPTDSIYISYADNDTAGNKLTVSSVVSAIQRLFPAVKHERGCDDEIIISTPEVTIRELMQHYDKDNPVYQRVYTWFKSHSNEWQNELSVIDAVDDIENTAHISADSAGRLYKNFKNYSVSRLERFYACPFMYFLEHGLKAKPRAEKKINKSDLGTLLHWAVQEYCKTVDNNGTPEEKHNNWEKLSEKESNAIIDNIFNEIEEKTENITAKTKNTLKKTKELLIRCVPVINLSFKNSSYTSAGYEWNFDNLEISDDKNTVTVHGIIDRLDITEDVEKAYMRVIDYKSGAKSFSVNGIYNRLDLQLGVYAVAAADAYERGLIGNGRKKPFVNGIFYDFLNDKFEKKDLSEFLDGQTKNNEKLDGMIFADTDENDYSADLFEMHDKELAEKGVSDYLKLSLTVKGTINKRYSLVGNRENIEAIQHWVKKAVLDADRDIKSGVIEAKPYIKNKQDNACDRYCPYKDVCAYERSRNGQYRKLYNGNDVFELMKED